MSEQERNAVEEYPLELTSDATCPDCGSHMEPAVPWDSNCEILYCVECGFNEPADEEAQS